MKIYGMYSRNGYQIISVDGKEELYSAGNSPYDSQGYVQTNEGLGLRIMRKFCLQTGKEIAQEQNVEFVGVERIEDDG